MYICVRLRMCAHARARVRACACVRACATLSSLMKTMYMCLQFWLVFFLASGQSHDGRRPITTVYLGAVSMDVRECVRVGVWVWMDVGAAVCRCAPGCARTRTCTYVSVYVYVFA